MGDLSIASTKGVDTTTVWRLWRTCGIIGNRAGGPGVDQVMFRARKLGALLLGALLVLAGGAAPAASAAVPSQVSDQGFWLGTDSSSVAVPGAGPFQEPVVGGAYGGYLGMVGDWARSEGCGDYQLAWSAPDAAAASTDLELYGLGVGTGGYWFMGGPGVDPHYDGKPGEAAAWGAAQAAKALAALAAAQVQLPVVWMDIELPGSTAFDPVPDNGWNHVYASTCSAQVVGQVPATLDRAEVDGFAAYVRAHSHLEVGVYSSPLVWPAIFGAGPEAVVHHLLEWTYSAGTGSLASRPVAWCIPGSSTCARFFGGVGPSSPLAVGWQWSGGGGITNGVGDFDQFDSARLPALASSFFGVP